MQSYARFYNKFVMKNCKMDDKMNFSPKKFGNRKQNPLYLHKISKKEHEYNKKSQKNLEKGLFWVYICS